MISAEKGPDTEVAICAGAIAATLFSLLPYASLFVLPSYFLGALVGVWYFVVTRKQSLAPKEGAKLGFYSTLLGNAVAVIIYDLVWQAFDYQIGQRQNAELTLGLLHSLVNATTLGLVSDSLEQNLSQPFAWHVALFQILGTVIFAAVFGSLFGLLCSRLIRIRKN